MTLIFHDGHMLSYKQIQHQWPRLRRLALNQLLHRLQQIQACTTPEKLWGDEIEYLVVKFVPARKQVKVLLRTEKACKELLDRPAEQVKTALWSSEVSCFQVETAPREPYGGATLDSLLDLSANIHARRQEFRQVLDANDGEEIVSISLFPMNGAPGYTDPPTITDASDSTEFPYPSIFYPHQVAVSSEPVFQFVVQNFLNRRQAQTCFYVPLYRDVKTPASFVEDLTSAYREQNEQLLNKTVAKLKPNTILIDSPGFGLSACSMQITQQAANVREATYLYDQLAVLCPIMMAVTAASPIVRGFMSSWDNRWLNFAYAWDDRTPDERGEVAGTEEDRQVGPHRIVSIETYTSEDSEPFNDIHVQFDNEMYQALLDRGVGPIFARYVAHLLIHTPTSLSDKASATETDQTFGIFTTIQDFTNWSIMRLKFPIINDNDLNDVKAGFRVEFRPMDLQPTSFENAAFITFVRLVSLALLHFRVDLRIPVSKLYENIFRSVEIDACRKGTFHWRATVKSLDESTRKENDSTDDATFEQDSLNTKTVPLTLQQIFVGTSNGFIGLIPLVRNYLKDHPSTLRTNTRVHIEHCIQFVEDKVTGKTPTTAQWVRSFVQQHEDYQHDSIIPQSVAYDLMREWQMRANADDKIV